DFRIGEKNRAAAGHGFENGKAEPLIARRKNERRGVGVEPAQRPRSGMNSKLDAIAEPKAQDFFFLRFRPRFSGNNQSDFPPASGEKGLEKNLKILVILPAAHVEKIWKGRFLFFGKKIFVENRRWRDVDRGRIQLVELEGISLGFFGDG